MEFFGPATEKAVIRFQLAYDLKTRWYSWTKYMGNAL